MKRIILAVLLLTVTHQIFADAYYVKRKRCLGSLQWKYISYACVNLNWGSPAYGDGSGTQKACTINTSVDKYGKTCPCIGQSPIPIQTRSEAHAGVGPSVNGFSWTYTQPGYGSQFSAGLNPNSFYQSYASLPMYEGGNEEYSDLLGTKASVSDGEVLYNESEHSISINGINAELFVDDPDMVNTYSTFKIFILNTNGDYDNLENADVITTFQAFIYNGELIVLGDLTNDNFTQVGNKAHYTLADFNTTIDIASNIDLDDVVVKFGTDIGNLENGVNEDYQINLKVAPYTNFISKAVENSKLHLDIQQNPVVNELSFILNNGTENYKSYQINIISSDGKIVYTSNELGSDAPRSFKVDVSSFAVGNYYLTVKTNTNEKFTRKFSLTK